MPKIRLNKAVKELNISVSRAVEFLQSKGIEVESNPNAILEEQAFAALEAEFRKDGEQRKASHEVVISTVPKEKLELEEEKKPEVIKAKATQKLEPKVVGKIELEPKKEEEKETVKAEQETPKKVEEAPKEEPAKTSETGLNVLGKIDLSTIDNSTKPKKKEKAQPKKEEKKPVAEPKPKQEVEPKKEEPKVEVKKEEPKKEEPVIQEPQKIETQYQKLDGLKILKEKVDLSQFQTKPKEGAGKQKKKRKRIEKPAQGQSNSQSTNQGNRPQGQQGNRSQGAGGNNQGGNRGGSRRGGKKNERVMPVELTDEQVKNQIKETLEKLTNKGGKSKAAKYRKEKRTFRREQDELQQEREAQDRTLKVTEYITV